MKKWFMKLWNNAYEIAVAWCLSLMFSVIVHSIISISLLFFPFFYCYVLMIKDFLGLLEVSKHRERFRGMVLLLKGNLSTQTTLVEVIDKTIRQLKCDKLKEELKTIHQSMVFGHGVKSLSNPFILLSEGEVLWELLLAAEDGVDVSMGFETLYHQIGSNILYFEELLTQAKGKYFEIFAMYFLSYLMFMLSKKSLVQPGFELVVVIGSLVIHFGVWLSALFIHRMLKKNSESS